MGFKTLDLIILIVYLIAILLVGLYFSKKDMQGKEYFRGDGTIPWWVTSVSIFATLLSPISFLSLVGNSYKGTWILWFAQVGAILAIPLTIHYFLPIYNKLNIDTAYQYLEKRYGSKSLRVLGALLFIVYQLGRMSIIMYLPSVVLSELMGINVNILIIIMGIIAMIYSYTGGIKSVLWTDFIQGAVLLVGVTITLFFLINGIDGGFTTVLDQLTRGEKFLANNEVVFNPNLLQTSVFLIIVGACLNTLSSYISSQDIVQRFTTTNDEKKLNKMMLTNGALSIFIATVLYLIGTGLYVFYSQNPIPGNGSQDQIFGTYIAYSLPVGVTGILLAAIYAASQSTISTGLNSVATSWTLDIQNIISKKELDFKLQTQIAKLISLIVGVISIIIAIFLANSNITSAYELFNSFMGMVLGILAGIFILGVFFKKANMYGAYAGFIGATIIMIVIKYVVDPALVSIWAYSLISIIITILIGLPVSYLTNKKCKNEVPKYTTFK